jgi:hypothetical protein
MSIALLTAWTSCSWPMTDAPWDSAYETTAFPRQPSWAAFIQAVATAVRFVGCPA